MPGNGMPLNTNLLLHDLGFPNNHIGNIPITFGTPLRKIGRHYGLQAGEHKGLLVSSKEDPNNRGMFSKMHARVKPFQHTHYLTNSPRVIANLLNLEHTLHDGKDNILHDGKVKNLEHELLESKSNFIENKMSYEKSKILDKNKMLHAGKDNPKYVDQNELVRVNNDRLHDVSLRHETAAVDSKLNVQQGFLATVKENKALNVETEQDINDRLTVFNHLANTLRDKFEDIHRVKQIQPPINAWNTFIATQERLKQIKQARQSVINDKLLPTCKRGFTVRGATLRGGILSGEFKSMGVVATQKSCTALCCRSKRCDIAMTIGRECINIKCFNKKACTIAPAGNLNVYRNILPVVTFVKRIPNTHGNIINKRSIVSNEIDETMRELDEGELDDIKELVHDVNMFI